MNEVVCFQHFINGVIIFVPAPPLTDQQKLKNISQYGPDKAYGVNRLVYTSEGASNLFVDISSRVIIVDMNKQLEEIAS